MASQRSLWLYIFCGYRPSFPSENRKPESQTKLETNKGNRNWSSVTIGRKLLCVVSIAVLWVGLAHTAPNILSLLTDCLIFCLYKHKFRSLDISKKISYSDKILFSRHYFYHCSKIIISVVSRLCYNLLDNILLYSSNILSFFFLATISITTIYYDLMFQERP